jgi:hypothetical protein
LPTVLPSLRKIAAKLLVDLARIKVIGRKVQDSNALVSYFVLSTHASFS